jgi:hypothetical protein
LKSAAGHTNTTAPPRVRFVSLHSIEVLSGWKGWTEATGLLAESAERTEKQGNA